MGATEILRSAYDQIGLEYDEYSSLRTLFVKGVQGGVHYEVEFDVIELS